MERGRVRAGGGEGEGGGDSLVLTRYYSYLPSVAVITAADVMEKAVAANRMQAGNIENIAIKLFCFVRCGKTKQVWITILIS